MATGSKQHPNLCLEQVKQLYEQSYIASGAVIAVSLATGVILWDLTPHINLVAWIVAAITISLLRYGLCAYFNKLNATSQDALYWKRVFFCLMTASGIIWGSSAFFLFPKFSLGHQVYLFFILIGMVAGAIGTFSVVISVFLAFAWPALIPWVVKFFLIGDNIHSSLGWMTLLFLMFSSVISYHLNKKSRTTFNLHFENMDLIHNLEQATHKTHAINKILTSEILERQRAEETLRKYQENLEVLVNERTAELNQSNIILQKEIEEREKTAKALSESEEKYRLLVENANDAICVHQDDAIKFHNLRVENLFGYSSEELSKMTHSCFFHPEDRPKVAALHEKAKSAKIGVVIQGKHEFRAFHKNNEPLWVQMSVVPVIWDNHPAVLCFTRDITLQKQLEQQLLHSQKMEAIGTMAAGIAHDFNNILSGIQGNISLVRMNLPVSDPFNNKLKDIESYIESGTGLTRQLMDFAKSKKPESIPFDIESLMDETAKMFGRTRKEIQLKTSYSSDVKTIEADPERIRQVIINLLINAWQAMPKGGELLIQTATESLDIKNAAAFNVHPGDYVKISISDRGTGIESYIIPKIFDPFFTTKKRGQGTGLGLATAYRIIKNHGGHISVESQPGNGSTFHLYLPLSCKQAAEEDGNVSSDQIMKGSEAILLVDDESDILEICKDLLEALGYTVFTARNGDQAIGIYRLHANRINLVILDMMMPMMNGAELYDRLIKINPGIKALLSSGYIQSDQAENLLKKGFKGFIQKPFNIQQLSNTVRKILN